MQKIAIIGGGASGFFLGANLAPSFLVHIYEKATVPLQKVRASGGGRCNVTHACFDPSILTEFYPRGSRELRSIFYQFMCGDTMQWFEARKVPLKIEEDGRVFPISDNSLDVVETLIKENIKRKTQVHLQETVKAIKFENQRFKLETTQATEIFDAVVIASGSSRQMWELLKTLGHTVVAPVPSLFSFNCRDAFLKELPGTVFRNAEVQILDSSFRNTGDLLFTHRGFSGPAILVLSAWAARFLAEKKYQFQIQINFLGKSPDEISQGLKNFKKKHPQQLLTHHFPFELTKKFRKEFLKALEIPQERRYADLSNAEMQLIADFLSLKKFDIDGKITNKDEFVTAGGVDLKEIDFKNMQSKLIPNLFMLGEVLNIDAVTGGFNFQACWSEAAVLATYLNKL